MSRPKPAILLSRIDPRTFKAEQVLKATAIYAVFFDGQPINLRSVHTASDIVGPKYKKVSFSNPGHAHNLCEKLNKLFRTDRFTVHRLMNGDQVVEMGE
jgi:hypothetical protein